MEEVSDDLESEVSEPQVLEPEVSEPEVSEPEVSEATEVYLCEGVLEQSRGNLRGLASIDPRRLRQF